eukprot:Skav224894  [mRNA]  locus=scaffold1112:356839:360746:+ [translate_table: standard]
MQTAPLSMQGGQSAVPTVQPLVAPVVHSPITPPTTTTATATVSFGEALPTTLPVTPPPPQVAPPPSPPLMLPQPVMQSVPSNPSPRWEPSPRQVPPLDAPRWRAREGAVSSRKEREVPLQDEWYQTLMSRLRRLGDQVSSPRDRAHYMSGEPITGYAQNPRPPMRSASREALNAKLRELGLERPDSALRDQGATPASLLLNDLPDRAIRRDNHSAAMAPGREELLF